MPPVASNQFADLAWPHSQLEAARAAGEDNQLLILSHASCSSMEDVVEANGDESPRTMQMFLWKDRRVVEAVGRRAEQHGHTGTVAPVARTVTSPQREPGELVPGIRACAQPATAHARSRAQNRSAVQTSLVTQPCGRRCVVRRVLDAGCRTVDDDVDGERPQGLSTPPEVTPQIVLDGTLHPAWIWCMPKIALGPSQTTTTICRGTSPDAPTDPEQLTRFMLEQLNPACDWDELRHLRSIHEGTLVVEGTLHPDEAKMAVELGADGVAVSDHGGRQLDHAPTCMEVLPSVLEAVGGKIPVLVDGGF